MAIQNNPADERRASEVPATTAWPMIFALGLTLSFAGLVTSVVVSIVGFVLDCRGRCRMVPRSAAVSSITRPFASRLARRSSFRTKSVSTICKSASWAIAPFCRSKSIPTPPASRAASPAASRWGYSPCCRASRCTAAPGTPSTFWPRPRCPISPMPTLRRFPRLSRKHLSSRSSFTRSASILVGLLYGVMLPMFPRYPALWAAIVAPLLWTGLLWSSLSVIDPVLDARIEWRWFILCQIAFGAVAGFVVNLTERVHTLQHLPFAFEPASRRRPRREAREPGLN